MPDRDQLTERQKAWFASVAEGLERETGRSLDQWIEIARACPETKHRARLGWFKEVHGLGQNRASIVLNAAFPADRPPSDALWCDPAAASLFMAVKAEILRLPDVLVGERKSFTAFSRNVQFAAARPDKSGLVLGLALPPDDALQPATRASWSERLTGQVRIEAVGQIETLRDPIRRAWERS